MKPIICRPRSLPLDKLVAAERRALQVNPANANERRRVAFAGDRRGAPRRIAVLTARKWPATGVKLSVSFLDSPKADLRNRILQHMNAWGTHANITFAQTSGVGEVRIARLDSPEDMAGYWSWLGTEILEIPEDEPTMNLEGFTMKTSEAEFHRVVRHEAGHTLGFEHEHMRSDIVANIDPAKAYPFFAADQNWDKAQVDAQVLTPLKDQSIMGTAESDPLSIMCYQLPGSIMRDGKPVKGGKDINPADHAFAAKLYPKKKSGPAAQDPLAKAPPAPPAIASGRPAEAREVFEFVVMDEFQSNSSQQAHGRHSKFVRVLATYRGARVTSSMRVRADAGEKGTSFGSIIGTHERIKAYTNRLKGSLPNDKELKIFGAQLFDTLLQGDIRRLYDEARTLQGRQLDLIFTSMVPWIADKPWEFAYDAARDTFLATEDIQFTRNVLTSIPSDPIVKSDGPLRILVVSAQPVGFGRLSIDEETAVIQRGFEPLVDAGLATITTLTRATPSILHGYLDRGNFQIVHFIGHGSFNEERGEGCLYFVNEQGEEYPLGERDVRQIFSRRGLSLVFLNACETGRGGRVEFNKGIAQSLVANGLPALVANQYSVLDSSATFFAQHFYWALSQGASLGHAAREARIAVNYSMQGEPIDWAVPVLYARDPGMSLCMLPAQPQHIPATRVTATSRRATRAHAKRIAVWDMDSVFPSIEKTLATMNVVQAEFGFELADLSLPLDVWELGAKAGDPAYLWAEQLVRRLRSVPVELGVDLLVCITRHWMCSEDWYNIYSYTAGDDEGPIMIFSAAGFEDLAARGRQTDRVIANVAAGGLAEFFGDAPGHGRGDRNCPLYFNESRNFAHLAAHQKFDAPCRELLKKNLGSQLQAIEALLDAFH